MVVLANVNSAQSGVDSDALSIYTDAPTLFDSQQDAFTAEEERTQDQIGRASLSTSSSEASSMSVPDHVNEWQRSIDASLGARRDGSDHDDEQDQDNDDVDDQRILESSPPYPPPPSYHATMRRHGGGGGGGVRRRDSDNVSSITRSSTSTIVAPPLQHSAPPMDEYGRQDTVRAASHYAVHPASEQDLVIPWWSAILPSPSLNRTTRARTLNQPRRSRTRTLSQYGLSMGLGIGSSSGNAASSVSTSPQLHPSAGPSSPPSVARSASSSAYAFLRRTASTSRLRTRDADAHASTPLPHSASMPITNFMTPEQSGQSGITFPDPPALPQPYKLYTKCYCEENAYILAAYLDRECRKRNAAAIDATSDVHWQWDVDVCFVSNANKSVALWQQRASRMPDTDHIVIWDYHVFVIVTCQRTLPSTPVRSSSLPVDEQLQSNAVSSWSRQEVAEASWVYDLDTRMPVPYGLPLYLESTFQANGRRTISSQFRPTFRVVSASDYLAHFASDRSHMLVEQTSEDEELDRALRASVGYHEREQGQASAARWSSPPPFWPRIRGPLAESSHKLMDTYVDMTSRRTISDGDRHGVVVSLEELMQGMSLARGAAMLDQRTSRSASSQAELPELSRGISSLLKRYEEACSPAAGPLTQSSLEVDDDNQLPLRRGDPSLMRRTSDVSEMTNRNNIDQELAAHHHHQPQQQPGFVLGVRRFYGRRPPPPVPGQDRFANVTFHGRGKRVSSPLFPAYMHATLQSRAAHMEASQQQHQQRSQQRQ